MKIGYARVSTSEQDLSGQLAALRGASCERIYSEKRSGANDDRAALKRTLKEVQAGDVVVVVRLDRLARSVRDLLNILERFSQDDVAFLSLREKHIDTTSAGGRLVLNIKASIAEFERVNPNRGKTAMKSLVFSVLLLIAMASAVSAQSCRQTAGLQRSRELVRQCLQVSPATHPPCNAANPCDLIVGEIKRGCAMLTTDAPSFCGKHLR